MYIIYAILGGGSGWPVDDFSGGVGSSWEVANIFWGGGVGQRNVGLTFRKMLHYGVDVAYSWMSDWTRL